MIELTGLPSGPAAVHHDIGARHKASRIACQKQDGACHFMAFSDATQHGLIRQLLVELLSFWLLGLGKGPGVTQFTRIP